MLTFLIDLILDMFAGGDAATRKLRSLRRKLVRYLKNAPSSAFESTDPRHLEGSGKIRRDVRARIVGIAKGADTGDVFEWEDLCARFLSQIERELPGITVQLPPDEPRMAYAGDKSL